MHMTKPQIAHIMHTRNNSWNAWVERLPTSGSPFITIKIGF